MNEVDRNLRLFCSPAPFDPKRSTALEAAYHALERLRKSGWCT